MLSVAPSPQPTLMGDEPIGKPEPAPGPRLEDLPPEVMVLVFHTLGMTDRMSLLRVRISQIPLAILYELSSQSNISVTDPYRHPKRSKGYTMSPRHYNTTSHSALRAMSTHHSNTPKSLKTSPSPNPSQSRRAPIPQMTKNVVVVEHPHDLAIPASRLTPPSHSHSALTRHFPNGSIDPRNDRWVQLRRRLCLLREKSDGGS